MKLRIITSHQTIPFMNLAVEQHLVKTNPADTIVMYLWKNHRTVVVGYNQNPYAECDVNTLLAEGGHLMRRLTGGGAVYHDVGNLNFSFIVPKQYHDVNRQFAVIQKAVESFGLSTEMSGRNDLLCQGRKFSGNAFSKGADNYLHHGTILIKTDTQSIQRYLRVKATKLQKHGVSSVQSRVVNLSELASVTSENIVLPLENAFQQTYGGTAERIPFEAICTDEVKAYSQHLASDDFLFAKWRHFTTTLTGNFTWGEVEMDIKTDEKNNCIEQVQIATDCLNIDIIDQAQRLLSGASLQNPPAIPQSNDEKQAILNDLLTLVYGLC